MGILRAGPAAQDVIRDLVEPLRRARLPAPALHRLTGVLDDALHNVFLLGLGLAVLAVIVAFAVPGRLGPAQDAPD